MMVANDTIVAHRSQVSRLGFNLPSGEVLVERHVSPPLPDYFARNTDRMASTCCIPCAVSGSA
jgi:hypothetical protein